MPSVASLTIQRSWYGSCHCGEERVARLRTASAYRECVARVRGASAWRERVAQVRVASVWRARVWYENVSERVHSCR